jgi:hypothetical protein
MNKLLITIFLGCILSNSFAQTKIKKQPNFNQSTVENPYSVALIYGQTETEMGNVYPVSILLDYKIHSSWSFRSRLHWYQFNDLYQISYNELSAPSLIHFINFDGRYRQFFLTVGPVFHIGNKWQLTLSPQVGLKATFLKTNMTLNDSLTEVRHFKPNWGVVFGVDTHIWYQMSQKWQIGVGVDWYGHLIRRDLNLIEQPLPLQRSDIARSINEKLPSKSQEEYVILSGGLKYHF